MNTHGHFLVWGKEKNHNNLLKFQFINFPELCSAHCTFIAAAKIEDQGLNPWNFLHLVILFPCFLPKPLFQIHGNDPSPKADRVGSVWVEEMTIRNSGANREKKTSSPLEF